MRASLMDSTPVSQLSDLLFETRIAAESLADFVSGGRLRLGVTGLSRSGKTVFITAFVQQLVRALAAGPGRQTPLPLFRVVARGGWRAPISIRSPIMACRNSPTRSTFRR